MERPGEGREGGGGAEGRVNTSAVDGGNRSLKIWAIILLNVV